MRYTVTLDAYLWADSEEEAKAKAEKLAKSLREIYDNQAQVLELHQTPFGTLTAKKIEL